MRALGGPEGFEGGRGLRFEILALHNSLVFGFQSLQCARSLRLSNTRLIFCASGVGAIVLVRVRTWCTVSECLCT